MSALAPPDALVKTHRINLAFGRIGNADDTAIPKTSSNMDPIAWELFISQHLARIAKARLGKAVKAAQEAGIIFDPETDPRPAGTNAAIYQSDVVRVSLTVASPRESVDHAGWVKGLLAVKPTLAKLAATLTRNHTVTSRAAHTFSTSLVTG